MAQTPQVQTLAQIMADLAPATTAQTNVINAQKSALPAKYDAQRSALGAEKTQGFNQINDQATGRGLSFSGIPLDEQATYLSTKYLPGLQQADYQQNQEGLNLDKELADVNSDLYKQAFTRQGQQQSDLNSWNMQQMQIEAQAKENALNRAAEAANQAANRAAAAPKGPTTQQVVDNINGWAKSRVGGDGKLSPSDFKAGYQQFFQFSGGSVDDYLALMQRYVNTSHAKDYTL